MDDLDKAEATMRVRPAWRRHQAHAPNSVEHASNAALVHMDLAGETFMMRLSVWLSPVALRTSFKRTAFAVIDGASTVVHHVALFDLDAAGDSQPGSIVELRKIWRMWARCIAPAVRSDLDVEQQVTAQMARPGWTVALSREPVVLGDGAWSGGEERD